MGNGSSEPMDSVILHKPRPVPNEWQIELPERDPVITDSPPDAYLKSSETRTFYVEYRSLGEVDITISARKLDGTPFNRKKNKRLRKCQRNSRFRIDKENATVHHRGRYTVQILDPARPKRDGANPAIATWQVGVEGSWCSW